jgi:hypothetical protein
MSADVTYTGDLAVLMRLAEAARAWRHGELTNTQLINIVDDFEAITPAEALAQIEGSVARVLIE